MPRKEFNFTIGADPEFNITMQGRRIKADDTIRAILGKDANFKAADMGFDVANKGNIGWDGAGGTGEIRPLPAKTADGLIDNIEGIFKAFCEKNPLFDISTLSYFGSVGGHMHFSVPNEYATDAKIRGIHKKLVSFYLPIMLSENKINLQLRLKSNYGQLSDQRSAQKTSEGKRVTIYEFRAPSAEWITTKKIALANIAYVATVYNEIINHPRKMNKYADLFYKTDKQANALQQLALADYKVLTMAIYARIKSAIKTFEFYKEYKEEIEYVLNPKRVIQDKANANYNIPEGWNLKTAKKNPGRRDITNKKKVEELSKDLDLDIVTSLVNISYNDDTNINIYAKTLSERVAIFNWKLKNTYYLFGLRKGIKEYLAFNTKEDGAILKGKEMIKTKSDLSAAYNLFTRMKNKFNSALANNGQSMNPESMMTQGDMGKAGSTIIIGIPYELRTKQEMKSFLNLIYDIEKDKEMAVGFAPKNYKELTDDSNKNHKNRGELYQVMNRTSEQEGVIFDERSAVINAQADTENLIVERNSTERIIREEAITEDELDETEELLEDDEPLDDDEDNEEMDIESSQGLVEVGTSITPTS